MTGSPSSRPASSPDSEEAQYSVPDQWEGLRDAPVVRADGVPMSRRGTGRRVRGADAVQPKRSRRMQSVHDAAAVVMVALLLSFVSQHVLVSGYLVTDAAMEPTLRPGDRVFANVLDLTVSGADRGEVIVFRRGDDDPEALGDRPQPHPVQQTLSFFGLSADRSQDFDVKRVVGVGGDRVSCCDAQGRIMVNEVPIDEAEAYLYPGEIASDVQFDVIVPDDQYFVLGDYRSASHDSRDVLNTAQGFVSHDRVQGTAFVLGWPLDRMGPLPDGTWVYDEPAVSIDAQRRP